MKPRRKSPAPKTLVGVDIIEMKKAREFFRENRSRLAAYFDQSEMNLIQKSQKPYRSLALLLAAKEAVFKASDLSWMGLDGFRKIRIISNKSNRLSFRLSGNYKRAFARRPHPALSFFTSKDFVVAECHR